MYRPPFTPLLRSIPPTILELSSSARLQRSYYGTQGLRTCIKDTGHVNQKRPRSWIASILESSWMEAPEPKPTVIKLADTLDLVRACISDLSNDKGQHASNIAEPCIAVGMKGAKLSRNGRVCLMQLKASHSNIVWLLDVTVLGQAGFTHRNTDEISIRLILETIMYKKILWDVRRNAEALWHIHAIDMKNILDIQLLEVAVRKSNKECSERLTSLAQAIPLYLGDSIEEWSRIKKAGERRIDPEQGGSREAFEQRPLPRALEKYAAQDVRFLASLRKELMGRLGRNVRGKPKWERRVEVVSQQLVDEAKRPPNPAGSDRGLSPQI
ncbi:hypothetical protein NMY22_g6798 [Coprinellus aureogranulatus]|nr:hypothetical protein NMY22_g6798 [Coprinellus aureogranulatus]